MWKVRALNKQKHSKRDDKTSSHASPATAAVLDLDPHQELNLMIATFDRMCMPPFDISPPQSTSVSTGDLCSINDNISNTNSSEMKQVKERFELYQALKSQTLRTRSGSANLLGEDDDLSEASFSRAHMEIEDETAFSKAYNRWETGQCRRVTISEDDIDISSGEGVFPALPNLKRAVSLPADFAPDFQSTVLEPDIPKRNDKERSFAALKRTYSEPVQPRKPTIPPKLVVIEEEDTF